MVDILDAARYFVYLSYGKNRYSLTPLKLQKLLYLAQGWSYVWDNKPAFLDEFSAWDYGPVSEKVYKVFRKYGRSEIPMEEGTSQLKDIDVAETLEAIWREFGKLSAYALVELTHAQAPWKQAYERGVLISNNSIRKYYQSTYLS